MYPDAKPSLTTSEEMLLLDDYTSSSSAERATACYICRDPHFAQMGLPLCYSCDECSQRGTPRRPGHVPADDTICTICGTDALDTPEYQQFLEETT